ncbi:MAG TPA: BatD family protein [Ignavibacteriaceae bacterium]|nr:BatD family protein [Ignavibacteriaceae bacterium]
MKNILLLFVIVPAIIKAQSFEASVDNTTIGLNDRFQVTFTFEGNDVNSLSDFSAPNFDGFMVLSGPNQSTSMQIINGAVSASLAYSFYLQPKNIGRFTIGSASIKYKGNTYKTSPLTIQVQKGSPVPNNSTNNSNNSGVDNDEIAKNVFVRASVDKQKAYMGEQVTVTYKLYTRLSIASQMSISKLPQYPGFWAEEIETPNNISFTTETLDGKRYRVGILKKVALFPTQTGQLNVTPFELDVPVQVQKKRSNNVFDDFFNDPFFGLGETIHYTAKSNSLKINVTALPSNGAPDSFDGAVGSFSLNSQIDKNKTKTNEPVTLKLSIEGTGNISLLDMPEINLPAGFEKYEPKVNEQINRTGKISGKKTAEYLIVPRDAGKKEIPPVKFSYFDINKKSYVTLSTPSYPVVVEQGSNVNSSEYAGKEDIKLLGNDIRFIKTDMESLHRKGNFMLNSPGFWTAIGVPLILMAGLVGWRRKEDRLAGNIQLMKYQRAQKIAKSRLKQAKILMEANEHNAFYSEISLALFGYLEDKLHIPKSELSVDKASSELKKRGLNEGLITEFERVANKCEFIRFAPKKSESAAMNEIYDELSHTITEIEKFLSVRRNGV